MRCQRMRTRSTRHARVTFALSGSFVAHRTDRTTDITAAVLATKQTAAKQIERTIFASVTASSINIWFARALSRFRFARVQCSDRTIHKTFALLASFRMRYIQIPKQWLTLVANATSHTTLALAQLPSRHGTTTSELGNDTSRIAVAFLASREVVETLFALVTSFAVKVARAQTLSVVVARDSGCSMRVAVTRQAFGVIVVSRAAERTLFASKVRQTWASSVGVARFRCTSGRRAVAGLTVRIVEEAGKALVATRSSKSVFADALTRLFAAHLANRALQIAVAVCMEIFQFILYRYCIHQF